LKKLVLLFAVFCLVSAGLVSCSAENTSEPVQTCTVAFYPNTDSTSYQAVTQVFTVGETKPLTGIDRLGFYNPGYYFAGWALTQDSEEAVYSDCQTVTLDKSINLYAVWSASLRYSVTVAGLEHCTISFSSSSAYEGEEISVYAEIDDGYKINQISAETQTHEAIELKHYEDAENYWYFIMPDEDVVFTLKTEAQVYSISVKDGLTGGQAVLNKNSACTGEEVVLTVTADYGYNYSSFVKVTGENKFGDIDAEKTEYDGKIILTFNMPAEDVVIEVFFTPVSNYVIASDPENGSMEVTNYAAYGTEVSVTLSPDEGYAGEQVFVQDNEGNPVSVTKKSESEYTFTMPATRVTVSCLFKLVREYSFHTEPELLPEGTDGTAGVTGKYVYFGDWPQTVKSDKVTVDEEQTFTAGDNTYYLGSDNFYYAKILENAYSDECKYSDRSVAKKSEENSYRYFKVEPVKWRVLNPDADAAENRILLAETILASGIAFEKDAADSATYETSDICTWLTDTFRLSAFAQHSHALLEHAGVVDDSNTNKDYVFLLSEEELINTAYGFSDKKDEENSVRTRTACDFAVANNVEKSYSGCMWMCRDVYNIVASGTDSVRYVAYDGKLDSVRDLDDAHLGICPAICISADNLQSQ
jgi:hypothetical protein